MDVIQVWRDLFNRAAWKRD